MHAKVFRGEALNQFACSENIMRSVINFPAGAKQKEAKRVFSFRGSQVDDIC